MTSKLFVLCLIVASVHVSAILATGELELDNYFLADAKKDFDYLNKWLSKTVNTYEPEENLRQAVDKLHRIGGDQLGLEKSILIMKHLAELDACDDKALKSLELVAVTTGAIGGVIRRLDMVMRHFAERAAAKCESYLEKKLAQESNSVQVNLEGLEPSAGGSGNFDLSLAKHDGRFNPNATELASAISSLARGDHRNVYRSESSKGLVYHFGNLDYTYQKYLVQPCLKYTRRLRSTVELIEPVKLFTSVRRKSGEDFFSRRTQGFKLALFRFQVCEDIVQNIYDLGDIFDALTI